MSEVKYLTVKEFANLCQRYPSHIYMLIKEGNKHRKLKSIQIDGRTMIPETELVDFPFHDNNKLKSYLVQRLEALETRVKQLEATLCQVTLHK